MPVNWEEWIRRPEVLAGAGAALVLLVVVVAVAARGGRKKAARVDEKAARARKRLRGDLQVFRDDLKKAIAGAEPVFARMTTETSFGQVIGHWRKTLRHRVAVRAPDLGALKGLARGLGHDSMPLSDLEAAWRKAERLIADYNAGKLDESRTPIATVKEFEKEIQKILVLANMCLSKYGG